jgi:hypothetical protein
MTERLFITRNGTSLHLADPDDPDMTRCGYRWYSEQAPPGWRPCRRCQDLALGVELRHVIECTVLTDLIDELDEPIAAARRDDANARRLHLLSARSSLWAARTLAHGRCIQAARAAGAKQNTLPLSHSDQWRRALRPLR